MTASTRTIPAPANDSDQSGRLQEAIDAAHDSGRPVVLLSSGCYHLDQPLILKDKVTLKGAGPSTLLKASRRFLESTGPHGGHPLITTDGASSVTIASLTADHSGDTFHEEISDRLREYLVDIRHSTDVLVDDVHTRHPFTYSIAVVASNNFWIRNSTTSVGTSGRYDQLDGIHILDSDSGLVTGNHVDQGTGSDGDDGLAVHTMGAPVHGVIFARNVVRGGRHGSAMQIAVDGHPVHDLTIAHNTFWDSPAGVITGYYGEAASVRNITITENTFIDNAGPSVQLAGRLSDIAVTANIAQRSGGFFVAGQRVSAN